MTFSATDSTPHTSSPLRFLAFATGLVAITLAIFWPVTRCDFLYWDDWGNVAKNPSFNPVSLDKIGFYYAHSLHELYIPITYTVWGAAAALSPKHAPDAEGITLSAGFFHGTNLLLHCISVVLAFYVLRRLIKSDWPAAAGTLLFAIHPVMVEPVTWVAGLKDVLCGCFCLAAIGQYVLYTQSIRLDTRANLHYAAGMVLFLLAMLSKPAAVSLPVALFAIGVGLLGRPLRRSVLELLPWLLLAVPIVVIGKYVQPAIEASTALWTRPFIAGDALAFYLGKTLWPAELVIDYGRNPTWLQEHGSLMFITTAVSLAAIGAAWFLRKSFPPLIVGLGVMIGAVLPVLGFVPFEFQGFSTVADHYLYLGLLGPAIVLGFALRRWGSAITYGLCALVFLSLGARTFTQIGYWRNMKTLRDHTVAVNPETPTSYYRVDAYMLTQQGKFAEALEQYDLALKGRPNDPEIHYNLANLLLRLNVRLDEAVQHYRFVMEDWPNDPKVVNNLGITLVKLQRYPEAEASFREAIRRDDHYADGHANLGRLMLLSGRFDQAAAEFQTALSIDPDNAAAKKGMADLSKVR